MNVPRSQLVSLFQSLGYSESKNWTREEFARGIGKLTSCTLPNEAQTKLLENLIRLRDSGEEEINVVGSDPTLKAKVPTTKPKIEKEVGTNEKKSGELGTGPQEANDTPKKKSRKLPGGNPSKARSKKPDTSAEPVVPITITQVQEEKPDGDLPVPPVTTTDEQPAGKPLIDILDTDVPVGGDSAVIAPDDKPDIHPKKPKQKPGSDARPGKTAKRKPKPAAKKEAPKPPAKVVKPKPAKKAKKAEVKASKKEPAPVGAVGRRLSKEPTAKNNNGRKVIPTIVELLRKAGKEKKPISKPLLVEKMCKLFPERPASSLKCTVGQQCPSKLRKEQKLKVKKSELGYWID